MDPQNTPHYLLQLCVQALVINAVQKHHQQLFERLLQRLNGPVLVQGNVESFQTDQDLLEIVLVLLGRTRGQQLHQFRGNFGDAVLKMAVLEYNLPEEH